MPTPKIFVSHSHLDSDFTKRLVADLRGAFGDEDAAWMDEYGGLHVGDAWVDKIVAEITARGIFLVVLSPAALPPQSKWVPFEMGIALRQHVEEGKRILPIVLRACAIPEAWKGIQFVDCTEYPTTYAAKLSEIVAFARGGVSGGGGGERHQAPRPESRAAALVQDANTAAGREQWSDVRDKTDVLIDDFPQEMTADLWRRRGRALLGLGDAAGALTALEPALDPQLGAAGADPHDAATLRLKGQAQARLGQVDPALQTLEKARKLARLDEAALKLDVLAEQFDLLLAAGRAAEALAVCDAALRIASGDADWTRRQEQATARQSAIAAAAAERARQEAQRQEAQRQEQARVDAILPRRLATFAPPLQTPFVLRRFWASEVILPPMVDIPAGPFWMGSEKRRDPQADSDEPWHEVTLGAYQIGRYPVTVAEYACALAAPGTQVPKPSDWDRQLQHPDHPVVRVSWQDAQAYLAWLGEATGDHGWRLPTEAEWEKAARWDAATKTARIYPWGDNWDKTRANTSDGGPKTTTPVGAYAERGDASPYGCHDMAGNVWEWTSSIYFAEAYQADNRREDSTNTAGNRVLRGGSWWGGSSLARAACRLRSGPGGHDGIVGFRLARVPVPGSR